MDPAVWGAAGVIVAGLIAGVAAVYGHRGAAKANHNTAVMTGYGGLVEKLQKERDKLETERDKLQVDLQAAYTTLSAERAEQARLGAQITALNAEIATLTRRITELGGTPT